MSYRATEMDLNSIFGELFKYVSKLLITLYKANLDSFGVVRKLDFVAIESRQNHAITLSDWGIIA